MWRSLLWKEWREQRSVLLAALILIVALPLFMLGGALASGRAGDAREVLAFLPLVYAVLVWPLVALATGAVTFSSDAVGARWVHLLSRPVSRSAVWIAKAATAIGVTGLAILATTLVGVVLRASLGPSPDPRSAGGSAAIVWLSLPGLLLLCWAAAMFWSLLLDRQVTIALAAALCVSLLFGAILAVRWRLDVTFALAPWTLAVQSLPPALALWLACFVGFRRGELLRGRPVRLSAGVTAAVGLGVAVATLAGANALEMRPPGDDALLSEIVAAPDGTVLATRARADSMSRQVQARVPGTGGWTRTAGRLSERPALSANGSAAAWLAHDGPLGLLATDRRLMVRWTPGGQPEIAVGGVPGKGHARSGPPVFSPDGRHLALEVGRTLWIASRDGRPPRTVGLEAGCRSVGWSAVDGRLLLFCGARRDRRRVVSSYYFVDPDTGVISDPVDLPAGTSRHQGSEAPSGGYRLVPFASFPDEVDEGGGRLLVVDLETREARQLAAVDPEGRVYFDVATRGRAVAWSEDVRTGSAHREASVWFRSDLASEARRLLHVPGGSIFGIDLSPDAAWAIVAVADEGSARAVAVRTSDGVARPLAVSHGFPYVSHGWSGEHTLVMLDEPVWRRSERVVGAADPGGPRHTGWYRSVRIVDLDGGEGS